MVPGSSRHVRAAREHGASRFDNQTSDPDRARSNLRQRDLLLNARLVAACQALGLRWIDVDEGLALDATLSLVEEHFRSHLPLTLLRFARGARGRSVRAARA